MEPRNQPRKESAVGRERRKNTERRRTFIIIESGYCAYPDKLYTLKTSEIIPNCDDYCTNVVSCSFLDTSTHNFFYRKKNLLLGGMICWCIISSMNKNTHVACTMKTFSIVWTFRIANKNCMRLRRTFVHRWLRRQALCKRRLDTGEACILAAGSTSTRRAAAFVPSSEIKDVLIPHAF